MVFEPHPLPWKIIRQTFIFWNSNLRVLIIHHKWEAWVMGLTFPWEPSRLDFQRCCLRLLLLGGALVLKRQQHAPPRPHAPSPAPPTSLLTSLTLLTSISPWSVHFQWKAQKLCAICLLALFGFYLRVLYEPNHSSKGLSIFFFLQFNRFCIWWTRWIYPVRLDLSLRDPPWWACYFSQASNKSLVMSSRAS